MLKLNRLLASSKVVWSIDTNPPLIYHSLTPLYDSLVAFTCREEVFRPALVSQANIEQHHVVLDVGCGTGSLTLAVKEWQPRARVVCLDADATALSTASAKATDAGLYVDGESSNIEFTRAFAQHLPFDDATFDRVVSSLVFHHLSTEHKIESLREIFRVLKPGGELHIADWGKAYSCLSRVLFFFVQVFDGFDTTADNVLGKLPEFMTRANFSNVHETNRFLTILGSLSLYKAIKPV